VRSTAAPSTFTFVGQAHGGIVPLDRPVLLILDTNVVSERLISDPPVETPSEQTGSHEA
jgi:hypothetical protein